MPGNGSPTIRITKQNRDEDGQPRTRGSWLEEKSLIVNTEVEQGGPGAQEKDENDDDVDYDDDDDVGQMVTA